MRSSPRGWTRARHVLPSPTRRAIAVVHPNHQSDAASDLDAVEEHHRWNDSIRPLRSLRRRWPSSSGALSPQTRDRTSGGVGGPPGRRRPRRHLHASPSPVRRAHSAASPAAAEPFTSAALTQIGFTSPSVRLVDSLPDGEGEVRRLGAGTDCSRVRRLRLRDRGAGNVDCAVGSVRPGRCRGSMTGRPEFSPTAARTGVVGGRPAVIVDADYVRENDHRPRDWLRVREAITRTATT